MTWIRGIFSLFAVILLAGQSAAKETINADHVKVSWIAPSHFSGEETTIGLHFQIDPHWHIYWKNPGDSGSAPKFKFQSNQAVAGEISWPVPKRFLISDLTNIGYETEVVFPLTLRPHPRAEEVQLTADLEWLVCQEECLPGFGQLTLQRPISKSPAQWQRQELLNDFLKKVPVSMASSPWLIEKLEREKDELRLFVQSKNASLLSSLQIFPVEVDFLTPAAPLLSADGKAFIFKIQSTNTVQSKAAFVLADTNGSWEHHSVPIVTPADESDWTAYLILLLSAFVGGIILNLMPCVLPVLSIKFFSLAKVSAKARWREAMLYTLGVLLTFTALGGLFVGLRAGGAAIGWGFQLQSPPIVAALILLFWIMGLSFLGFFEFGNSLTRAAGKFENTGAFATGCLSVFIATPCTGPFMGTALGAAAVLPAGEALLIFFFLGLGLASPFLALAFFPKIRLPRPGMWMVTLRELLAFPLFATVLWLLWVLGMQIGTDAWLYLTTLGLVLSFCIWLGKGRTVLWKSLALAIALLSLGLTANWVVKAPLVASSSSRVQQTVWLDYDPRLIVESKAKAQAVFVDFTAAWCVTCQVNKKAVLDTDAAQTIFAKHNVRLIRADWTNLDPVITEALAAFDRASVPFYLFYPADGSSPQILPQILTLGNIESLFQK